MHFQRNQNGRIKVVLSLEEKLEMKIRTNPTPRNERNYPVKMGKRY